MSIHMTHTHPLLTLATLAACETADRPDYMAGALLAEAGDDPRALRYLSALFVDRADPARAIRANHSGIRMGDPHGEESKHADAPDGYLRVQSSTVKRRSNSGASYSEVTVHGRSYVAGATRGRPDRGCTMSVAHLAHALDTAPRTALGHVDGLAVSRLTDVAYPDLPRMSGGDTVAWADFAAWDEIRARTPRRGHRPRLSLPRVTSSAYAAGPGELVAPRDADTVWIGHRVAPRIATYRETRAMSARQTRESFTCATLADVPATIASALAVTDGPGRWTWQAGEARGSFTRSKSGTVNVNGAGVRVSKARSVAAAVASVARQLADV